MSTLISGRKPHLDILRVLCIFFVVYMHTYISAPPVHITTGYYIYLMSNMCIKVAIPIFFMISGAVLLQKEETVKTLLSKRIYAFIVIILSTLAIQLFIGTWLKDSDFFLSLLGKSTHHYLSNLEHDALPIPMSTYWYMYAYLGLLIMLPILRPAAQNMKSSAFLYLIAAYIITVFILPIILCLTGYKYLHPLHLHLPFYSTEVPNIPNGGMNYLFYALVGYYLEHRVTKEQVTKRLLIILSLASVLCLIAACAMMEFTRIQEGRDQVHNFFFATKFTVIPAITLFLLTKHISANSTILNKYQFIFAKLGRAVIIVFLFENIIRHCIAPYHKAWSAALSGYGYASLYLSSIIQIIVTVAIGLSIGLVLQHIPGIKRYL